MKLNTKTIISQTIAIKKYLDLQSAKIMIEFFSDKSEWGKIKNNKQIIDYWIACNKKSSI